MPTTLLTLPVEILDRIVTFCMQFQDAPRLLQFFGHRLDDSCPWLDHGQIHKHFACLDILPVDRAFHQTRFWKSNTFIVDMDHMENSDYVPILNQRLLQQGAHRMENIHIVERHFPVGGHAHVLLFKFLSRCNTKSLTWDMRDPTDRHPDWPVRSECNYSLTNRRKGLYEPVWPSARPVRSLAPGIKEKLAEVLREEAKINMDKMAVENGGGGFEVIAIKPVVPARMPIMLRAGFEAVERRLRHQQALG